MIIRIETTGCGVFIGAAIVEIPTMGQKPLWDDARHILDSLRTARSPAAAVGMLQRIAAEMPPTAGKDSVVALFATLPQSSAVISNLGVLPLAVEYGSLRLKAVWGRDVNQSSSRPTNDRRQHVCRPAPYGSSELGTDISLSGSDPWDPSHCLCLVAA
jgi:hypothetical protein